MIKLRNAASAIIMATSLSACMTPADGDMADSGLGDGQNARGGATGVMVGGAEMLASRNIVENASNSADHTTLVNAVKTAGLVETLSGPGPFTVFAPTNAAFAKLSRAVLEAGMRPENKAALTSVLTYHVVAGRMSAEDLMAAVRAGNGTATLSTVSGATLTARMSGDQLTLTDGRGGIARVTQADVFQSNGVIHVTDAVSLPAS